MSPSTKKNQNDTNDHFDNQGDTEPQKLQKQLRQMEKEKLIFLEEKIKKQNKKQKIIDLFKIERNNLKEDLNIIQQGPHAKRITAKEIEMEKLLSKKDGLIKTLENQKNSLYELEGLIKKLEIRLKEMQENSSQINKKKIQMQKSQGGQLLMLENQLEVVNKRCGQVITENSSLRLIIDHMLIERAHFNDMWEKMVYKLESGKKYILELIEQSINAYDQREELCNKIQNLKEKSLTESTIHIQEMRELQRKLDHDAKLQQFFEIKGQLRTNADLEIRETNKKIQVQRQLEKLIQDYDTILDSIKNLCNEQRIENLGKNFAKQEEENFALFNYVNELSHEVETLNEIVQDLRNDAENQRGKNENKEASQIITIEILEKDLQYHLKQSSEAQFVKITIEKNLDEILYGIEKIFRLVRRGGDAPILELLGEHKEITIFNVKLFLGIIKLRATTIINSINFTDQPSKILARKDRIPKFNVKTKYS